MPNDQSHGEDGHLGQGHWLSRRSKRMCFEVGQYSSFENQLDPIRFSGEASKYQPGRHIHSRHCAIDNDEPMSSLQFAAHHQAGGTNSFHPVLCPAQCCPNRSWRYPRSMSQPSASHGGAFSLSALNVRQLPLGKKGAGLDVSPIVCLRSLSTWLPTPP